MPRFLLLLVLLFLGRSVLAFDVGCTKAWAEMSDQYPELVCLGDRLMLEGRYSKALHAYRDAAKLEFFESPNFMIYVKVARAECAIGEHAHCEQTLHEFELMLDLYVGKRVCPGPDVRKPGASLSNRAIRVMCNEVLVDSYRDRSEAAKKRTALMEKSFRRQVKVLRAQYRIADVAKSR